MKKYSLLLVFGLLISLSVVAQPNWKTTESSVTFKNRNAGLNVDGTFSGFSGLLVFDPAMPEKARLLTSVDAPTLETDINIRNSHLKKPVYFDVAAYQPEID